LIEFAYISMSGSITELTNAMAPLSILDASGLKAIGSAVNAIGKIPDLSEKLKAADLDAFSDSCNKISTALTPLASQLDKVGNAFAKLPPQLSKVVTQANRVTAANEKQRKSYLSLSNQMNGFMRNMAKLVSLKAIAEYLGNAVAKFNDFYEATDLFHNAMGNLSGEADTLISKMQGLLGVDPTKAMTYMATIQSLGTSFGLASDKAYVLSKNLTQLAYDEGSYWNKDVAVTFTAMSSAISGEIEPIRRLGVDLSQARLQQELLALGFNKQVRDFPDGVDRAADCLQPGSVQNGQGSHCVCQFSNAAGHGVEVHAIQAGHGSRDFLDGVDNAINAFHTAGKVCVADAIQKIRDVVQPRQASGRLFQRCNRTSQLIKAVHDFRDVALCAQIRNGGSELVDVKLCALRFRRDFYG
jgi:hypothetical protein